MIGPRVGLKLGERLGPAVGVGADPMSSGSSAPTTTTLTVVLADSADPVLGGANFNYTAIVTNTGAAEATSVSCVVTLDGAVTFVSASGTGWVCNHVAGVVTCTRATLAVGAAPTITVTVTAPNADDTLTTTADADASNSDPATQDSENTTVVGQTTLTVAIADSADPVITVVNYNYTTVVTNTGANTATSVVCTITLDPQLTHVSTSGTGWTVDTSALPVITCTRATLTVGAAPTITTTVTSPTAAETSSTTADADAGNSPNATQDTETTVCNLVTKDATSGIRVPASGTEWTNFLAYHAISISIASMYLCQETSGNLADSIGSLTLTANGTPLYDQAATGWTRKAVGFNEGAAQRFMAAAAAGPNPTTTSSLWCFYAKITAVGGTRTWMSVSDTGATQCLTRANVTPRITNVTVGATVSGGEDPTDNGFEPHVLQYDRTNSKANSYDGAEKIVGTYNAGVLDGRKGIGGAASNAPTGQCVYGFMLSGANAEISTTTLKTLLQALGFTIAWSP